jgi:hypothetical protein
MIDIAEIPSCDVNAAKWQEAREIDPTRLDSQRRWRLSFPDLGVLSAV